RYRKIHRFDADLPSGVVLRESATTAAGRRPVVLQTSAAAIGLSICYDLRFPNLYSALAEAGAEVIVAPSAFTMETGVDHWQVLVRARALDTQCYVLAAALCGRHNESRHSFGHSMIVDPWGTVIAQAPRGETVLIARVSRVFLDQIRNELPILRHQVLPWGAAADRIDLRGVT
ncbi:MAG TPA: carbon-nitrogen hydrolase family protein, partial [Nannocystis exedens]|nr:carbon-nitrogen hydrolase family protein [Nannocystis exedens]